MKEECNTRLYVETERERRGGETETDRERERDRYAQTRKGLQAATK